MGKLFGGGDPHKGANPELRKLLVDHVKKIGLDKFKQENTYLGEFLEKYPINLPNNIPYIDGATMIAADTDIEEMLRGKKLTDEERREIVAQHENAYQLEKEEAANSASDKYAFGGFSSIRGKLNKGLGWLKGKARGGWNWIKNKARLAKSKLSDGWNFLKGKFATRPTDEVDADGNPVQYGEAGTEAIMPIESKPGNLVDVIGKKIAAILSGKDIGPTGDTSATGESSVHAGTEDAAPMENKLATELADSIKRSKREPEPASMIDAENTLTTGKDYENFVDKMKQTYLDDGSSATSIQKIMSAKMPVQGFWRNFVNEITGKELFKPKTRTDIVSALNVTPGIAERFADGGFIKRSKRGNLARAIRARIAAMLGKNGVLPTDVAVADASQPAGGITDAITDSLGEGLKTAGTSALGSLAKTGLTAGATALGGPIAGLVTNGLMNSDIVSKGVGAVTSGVSGLLTKGIGSVTSGAGDLLNKTTSVVTNPLDKLRETIFGKKSESSDSKGPDISGLLKSSSGNGDKLGELLETNKKLYELLSKVLESSDGIKIQGMDGLLQATMASAQNGEGGGSPTIVMKNDERKGLDFSKTGNVERQKFNG